jgi:hypothetical protein
MREAGVLTEEKKASYRAMLGRVRAVRDRYRNRGGAYAELSRIAAWIDSQWSGDNRRMIEEERK